MLNGQCSLTPTLICRLKQLSCITWEEPSDFYLGRLVWSKYSTAIFAYKSECGTYEIDQIGYRVLVRLEREMVSDGCICTVILAPYVAFRSDLICSSSE